MLTRESMGWHRGLGRGKGHRWRHGQGMWNEPQPQALTMQQINPPPPGIRRIIAVIDEDKGLESTISTVFGRAPYIAIIDVNREGNILSLNITHNPSLNMPQGAGRAMVQRIISMGASTLIVSRMGPHVQQLLQQYGIQMVTVPPGTPLRQALRYLGVRA